VIRHAIFSGFARKLYALTLLGASTISNAPASDSADSRKEITKSGVAWSAPKLQPTYEVSAGIDGDIFPVFANYASMQRPRERESGVVDVTVRNSSTMPLRQRIAVRISGWSDQEIQTVEVASGATKTFRFAPTFLPKLYRNREITGATAIVEVSEGNRIVFDETVPVRLRSAQDMYWGSKFKYAPFIAAWVTPHELHVEKILARAKNTMPGRRLPGYEQWKDLAEQERSTYAQAKAIYEALQKSGLSYVKSSTTFGSNTNVSQRVRMPRESIETASANCIDGAVMFSSLFENLGMDPLVVLVPGHAYVGVRVARGSQHYLFIDSALTGRVSFEAAVQAAETGLAKYDGLQITRIPIDQARSAGIYPMP
jgi:hypothetical protein